MKHSTAAVLIAALMGTGCAVTSEPLDVDPTRIAAEETTPLSGSALLERREELERAQRDLRHFRSTAESLSNHRDRRGSDLFRAFVHAYMGMHLDPLLTSEWQSRHPELAATDANLRLIKADVLVQMREVGRAQQVIDDLGRRFKGREDMLIEFPIGHQTTLRQALEILSNGKWRG